MKRYGKERTWAIKHQAKLTEVDKAALNDFRELLKDLSLKLGIKELCAKHGDLGFTEAELAAINNSEV